MEMRLDPSALKRPLLGWLGVRVVTILDEHADILGESRREKSILEANLRDLAQRLARMNRELRALRDDVQWLKRPFASDMTIHQARSRHPCAPEVLARHHLPACDGCAVRFDETIAEAASAYGLALESLMGDLNALL